MVYHYPTEQPMGNSVWLGPLRLIFSDHQAVKVFRLAPMALLETSIVVGGLTTIITKWIDWPQSVVDWYNKNIGLPIRSLIIGAGTARLACAFVSYIRTKYYTHIKRPDGIEDTYKFFRSADTRPTPEQQKAQFGNTPGAMYVRDEAKWIASPVLTIDGGLSRAFNTIGMKKWHFYLMELTVGMEYPLTACYRIAMHYCGFGWNQRVTSGFRYNLYQGVLNSSIICFTEFRKKYHDPVLKGTEFEKVDLHGHVVMSNVRLPYADESTRTFERMIIFMDHKKFEVEKIVMVLQRECDAGLEVTVWGAADHRSNTDWTKLTPKESLHQAGILLAAVVACFCHGTVHWWSNAVAALPAGAWKTAPQSNDITQWMNSQAVFLSWLFFGNSLEAANNFLVYNHQNGLPMHGLPSSGANSKDDKEIKHEYDTQLMGELGKRSTFHQMSSAVQDALMKHYNEAARDDASHTVPEVQGILAATLQHNLEHFFVGEMFPCFSEHAQCVVLKTDLSGLFMALVYPISYWSRRLLCKDYADEDPVCAAIYKAATTRAAELKEANHKSHMEGEIPVYADPKKFCDLYLNVGCAV